MNKQITKRLNRYGNVLNANDVADILGVSISTTNRLLRSGLIESFPIGHERKIPKACLMRYIEQTEQKGGEGK